MTEWSIIWEARGAFLNGALNTLILFVLSVLAAFIIGCFSVYLLEGRNWLSTLLRGAINLMRMLPFLVLAYLLYYGLPALGIKPSAWGARLVLPLGQVEAAKAHGFRPGRLYWRIILPQLVIRTRPLLGNQLIYALKDTAFLTIITVQELTAAANSVQATYFIPTEAFIVVIALYWIISICLELALKWASRFGAKRGFEHA